VAQGKTTVLRIIGAVLAGYLGALVLAMTTTALLRSVLPIARMDDPPAWYEAIDMGYALVFMVVGGWIAGRIGRSLTAPGIIAGAFLVLGLVTLATGADTTHPLAYQWATTLLGPAAVLLGGWIAHRRRDSAHAA
jgi:hypothetical protein